MFGDADIPFMLQDFGVPVSFGGYSVVGLLDDFDERDSFRSDLDLVNRIRAVSIQSGSAVTPAFARASSAYQTNQDGSLTLLGPNVLRNAHYVLGVLQPPLIEGASTNVTKSSRNLTTADWAPTGTGTRTQNATGLDGTANSATTLNDTDAASIYFVQENYAVPNETATYVLSAYILKDAITSRFPLVDLTLSGGTVQERGVQLNTQTGAIATISAVGTGHTARVVDGGLWWIVEITVLNNSTGNTNLRLIVAPADGSVFGAQNNNGVGSAVFGQMQVELGATAYSSPIFTGLGATASRAADIDQMIAATAGGYTRQLGSFITDGFKVDKLAQPVGLASNPASIITAVTDLSLSVAGRRAPESVLAGRSLYVGLPGLKRGSVVSVNGSSLKVRDILQSGDGALTQLHVVTP